MNAATLPPSALESAPAVRRVFGARPFHTDGDLLALAFAPDGGLWSVEEPGVLRHWDVGEKRQLDWFPLEEAATLWCFGPDAGLVAAASNELTVWDVPTGELRESWTHPASSWITALAFQPTGKGKARAGHVLAAGDDDGVVRLWDWANQEELMRIHAHGTAVSALAFSPDGRLLATAGEKKVIHLWEADTGRRLGTLLGHTDRIPALAWHPDGRQLVSAGWDTTARVWDTMTCQPIILLNSHDTQVHALAFSPDGTRLACADSANAVHVWDFDRKRTLVVLRNQGGEVRCLAFSPDGQTLASGGGEHVIHLWNARAGTEDAGAVDALVARTGVAVTTASRLASLGGDNALRVYDLATGEAALELRDAAALRAFAASPDGKWFAASVALPDEERADRHPAPAKVAVWDAATGRVQTWLEGQSGPVTAFAFAPDSMSLASGGYQHSDVWLWEVPSGKAKLLITGAVEGCAVEALAFHPQGRLLAVGGIDYLATGGTDGRIALWDVIDRRPVRYLDTGATALAFSPDGTYLAAATLRRTVHVWDTATGRVVACLAGHAEAVTCVAFSPDGRIVTGSDDRTVRLWDPVGGKQLGAVELDTQVKALAFAPDGETLFTGNGNASCYQLEVSRLTPDS
jgi:WD40 repeat protein